MRLFIYGISSLSFWAAASRGPLRRDRLNADVLLDCEPTPKALFHLESQFPWIPMPYHLSTTSQRRKPLSDAVNHLCIKKPEGKAFCRIGNGLYASTPELCFLQLASWLSFHELVRAGNLLCGSFTIDPADDGALIARPPLTTKRRIQNFLNANQGIPGIKKALKALPWVTEKTASPPEAFLAMVLGLPFRLGGLQIRGLEANRRLEPSRKAQTIAGRSTLVPDLLLRDSRLAIEYDSTAEHAESRQLTRDAQKRLALEADGYKIVTVTTKQLANRFEMRRIAEQIYRHQGMRFRPQSQLFNEQQVRLFRMGWSLEALWTHP